MISSLAKCWWFWGAVVLVLGTGLVSTFFLADCQGPVNKAMSQHEVQEILGDDTIFITSHEGDFGLIFCNAGLFPGYSDHVEAWFSSGGALKDKTFTKAPLWKKIQRVFLPKDETDRELYFRKH